jgi:hypothetical protein
MRLGRGIARTSEINPHNITNNEKQKENRAADQFFSSLLEPSFVNKSRKYKKN